MNKFTSVDYLTARLLDTWWFALLVGGVAIILGGILLFHPAITLLWLVRGLGVYWLTAGLAMVILALRKRGGITLLLRGVLGILIGIFVLGHPLLNIDSAPLFLVYLLVISAFILGGVDVVTALRQRRETTAYNWSVIFEGIFTILIGIFLLVTPLLSLKVLVPLVAISSIVAGIGLIIVCIEFGNTIEG